MVNDPRKLRPSELCRLLNSTPLGEVINERQLHRHRTRAGLRLGDTHTVDLLRYVAWLVEVRHTPKTEPEGDPYEQLKDRSRARNAALALAGRDIGELPEVVDPARKSEAAANFRFFCESYFPLTFHLPWSPDHLKVMAKIEQAVLHGGLFAMAMPRGSGKTSICECACIWAVLYGHQRFVALIGSDEGHAMNMLDSIKTELEGNDALMTDFPEVIHPIWRLEGIANRCAGQSYLGQRTHIGWTTRAIVLPTIPGSAASGAIINVGGLTGRIRGMKHKLPDGTSLRPSLVILDDPQTDESARSPSQCATRESIIAGAVLGLAGPGKKISGIMPCTVIRPGDMADNILDRDAHPQWQGERTRMVYAFPANEKLWDRYAEIRAQGLIAGEGLAAATRFYRDNQAEMDMGAQVAWAERFNYDEVSAVQHAMNLRLQDEAAFWAEYQNEPLPVEVGDVDELTAEFIAGKTNGLERQRIPVSCNHLRMFIDVQAKLLYYVIVAWEDHFAGYVVDYGTWPDQQRPYFTLRDATGTLSAAVPKAGLEGSIYAGLELLTSQLLARKWIRDDGAEMELHRCLKDANWGQSTEVVYQFCRQSQHSSVVMPSHGRFVGASSLPLCDLASRPKPGEQRGVNWIVRKGRSAVRHVTYDTNYWKSFCHARLAVAMGDQHCLSLFGKSPVTHRLFAEHMTSEYRVKTEGRGRVVDEWKQRPDRRDNHWLDCLAGCAVAASISGVRMVGAEARLRPARQPKRITRETLAAMHRLR